MSSISGREHSALKSDFIPSLKWEDMRLWRLWGAAAADEPRRGLRAPCSSYRLTEASDPATASLSKVTQAKSEHKRFFLPALLELASIKSSAGSPGAEDGPFLRTCKLLKSTPASPRKDFIRRNEGWVILKFKQRQRRRRRKTFSANENFRRGGCTPIPAGPLVAL